MQVGLQQRRTRGGVVGQRNGPAVCKLAFVNQRRRYVDAGGRIVAVAARFAAPIFVQSKILEVAGKEA